MIGAELVGADDAELLGVPLGSPVLVAERITRNDDGRPVLVSQHVVPGASDALRGRAARSTTG